MKEANAEQQVQKFYNLKPDPQMVSEKWMSMLRVFLKRLFNEAIFYTKKMTETELHFIGQCLPYLMTSTTNRVSSKNTAMYFGSLS